MGGNVGRLLNKAQNLIAQAIQNRTFFTRADLANLLSLDPNVQTGHDYLVTVQTLTERRYFDWFEHPDLGRFVPKAPANLNSVWDITSTPPSGFVAERQIYPIAGSQQVFACPVCGGGGRIVRVCYSCNGGGVKVCRYCSGIGSKVCDSCNGSGTRIGFGNKLERCSSCDGSGRRVCYSCNGTGREVCSSCDGTGRITHLCYKCVGVGRLIRYQAVVCEFKPHEFNEVISPWNLPVREMKAAEASDTFQTHLNPSLPPTFSQFPTEVQSAINSLVSQVKGLEGGDTQLVRTQLTVKVVPVAHVSFRLYGVPGEAWLLGKSFERVYLPKVPITFGTWFKLKDWVSIGLMILSFLSFLGFLYLFQQQQPFDSSTMVWLLVFAVGWVATGLVLLVRRLLAGLFLFALTIGFLAKMVYTIGNK